MVGGIEEAIEKAARKQSELSENSDSSKKETQILRSQLQNQQKQLEESHVLLASNQQMIQWLNSQLNVSQIGRLGTSMRHPGTSSGRVSTSNTHS